MMSQYFGNFYFHCSLQRQFQDQNHERKGGRAYIVRVYITCELHLFLCMYVMDTKLRGQTFTKKFEELHGRSCYMCHKISIDYRTIWQKNIASFFIAEQNFEQTNSFIDSILKKITMYGFVIRNRYKKFYNKRERLRSIPFTFVLSRQTT